MKTESFQGYNMGGMTSTENFVKLVKKQKTSYQNSLVINYHTKFHIFYSFSVSKPTFSHSPKLFSGNFRFIVPINSVVLSKLSHHRLPSNFHGIRNSFRTIRAPNSRFPTHSETFLDPLGIASDASFSSKSFPYCSNRIIRPTM